EAALTQVQQRLGAMRNEKNDNRLPSGTAQPGDAEAGRPATAPAAKFFLAVHRSTLGASRIYRVYPDADGLSLLGLGPPHPWIDLESARKLDGTHWAIRTAQVIRKGVALAVAGGSAAAGVLGIVLLKAALRDAPKVLDLILFVLTAVGISVPLGLLVLTSSIRLFTGRVAYVDPLAEKQIRKEAERGEWYSFWAAANDVGDASIDPVEAKAAKGKPAALLSFSHAPTGKWKLELVAPKDTKAAGRALKQLLGEDGVQVNVRVKRD
ncbi:MAG TPA: hypothetical protein VGY58_05145, partial [Gemmataceae bacterium]|nr:hypothetical protein [Gemmataceae bacterium]